MSRFGETAQFESDHLCHLTLSVSQEASRNWLIPKVRAEAEAALKKRSPKMCLIQIR